VSCPTSAIIKHFPPRQNKRHRRLFVEWLVDSLREQGVPLTDSPAYAEIKDALSRYGLKPCP